MVQQTAPWNRATFLQFLSDEASGEAANAVRVRGAEKPLQRRGQDGEDGLVQIILDLGEYNVGGLLPTIVPLSRKEVQTDANSRGRAKKAYSTPFSMPAASKTNGIVSPLKYCQCVCSLAN